jgi:hypothetical protein
MLKTSYKATQKYLPKEILNLISVIMIIVRVNHEAVSSYYLIIC